MFRLNHKLRHKLRYMVRQTDSKRCVHVVASTCTQYLIPSMMHQHSADLHPLHAAVAFQDELVDGFAVDRSLAMGAQKCM